MNFLGHLKTVRIVHCLWEGVVQDIFEAENSGTERNRNGSDLSLELFRQLSKDGKKLKNPVLTEILFFQKKFFGKKRKKYGTKTGKK